eukprot:GHVL01023976.1.p1 GENE.GHVL01023976.1~~GHVL01023976.1.p1  ORF type:complete len:993 (+),score=130.30 GHVL01023976.1:93-3071(+)
MAQVTQSESFVEPNLENRRDSSLTKAFPAKVDDLPADHAENDTKSPRETTTSATPITQAVETSDDPNDVVVLPKYEETVDKELSGEHVQNSSSSASSKENEDLLSITSEDGAPTFKPIGIDIGRHTALSESLASMCLDKAKTHLRKSGTTHPDGSYRSFAAKHSDLGVYGPGVHLYFDLLYYLGIIFLVLSLLAIPALVFFTKGDLLGDQPSINAWDKTTIANFGNFPDALQNVTASSDVPEGGAPVLNPETGLLTINYFDFYKQFSDRPVEMFSEEYDIRHVTVGLSSFDLIGGILFLFFMLYFIHKYIPKVDKKNLKKFTSIVDYSIQVQQLPRRIDTNGDIDDYKKELKEHFERVLRRGRVSDIEKPEADKVHLIELVHDHHGGLFSYFEAEKLIKRLDHLRCEEKVKGKDNKEKIAKISGKYETHAANICNLTGHNVVNPDTLGAFVTFSEIKDRNTILDKYRLSRNALGRLCQKRKNRFLGKYRIRIQNPPFPTNIIWENTDFSNTKRNFRRAFTLFFSVFLLGLVTAVIFAAKIYQSTVLVSNGDGCTSVGDIPLETAKVIKLKSDPSDEELQAFNCFCEKSITTFVSNAENRIVCLKWLEDYLTVQGLTVLVAIGVVIVNILLKIFLVILTRWERPISRDNLEQSLMIKVFVAQLLNTGLLALVLNAHFLINLPGLGGGSNDFDNNWYTSVGTALVLTMMINIFSPLVQLFFLSWRPVSRWISRKKCVTQDELLELYTNPEFSLADRLGQILTTVFVTLLYSSGMPVLYLFAFGSYAILLNLDKLIFLYGSKRPVFFSSAIVKNAAVLIPFSIWLHHAFAVWVFSNPTLFPSNKAFSTSVVNLSSQDQIFDGNRIIMQASIGHMVVWCILTLVGLCFFIKYLFGSSLTDKLFKKGVKAEQLTFEQAKEEMDVLGRIASYSISDNPNYRGVARVMGDITQRAINAGGAEAPKQAMQKIAEEPDDGRKLSAVVGNALDEALKVATIP